MEVIQLSTDILQSLTLLAAMYCIYRLRVDLNKTKTKVKEHDLNLN